MSGRPRKAVEAHPFVKWAGGKTQLLEHLVAKVPELKGVYHEPFVGGGALFFKLRALGRIKKASLSDVNPDLMNAYTALRDAPEAVIAELEILQGRTSEKDFYEIRAQDPDKLTAAQRTARLVYLNKTGFNGLYRVNRKGGFNVPYGRYANPRVLDKDLLMLVSRALKGVRLELGSFSGILKRAKAGDFVYFDPPYEPVSKSASFTAYAKGGFGEAEQRQLARVVQDLAAGGVEVLLSNSDTPLARELYEVSGLQVERVDARRAINSKGTGRGVVKELVVRACARVKSARSTPSTAQLSIDFASGTEQAPKRTSRP